jgi:hypothetical protein
MGYGGTILIPRSPHGDSPDLSPNDFWLFPKIKYASKGRRCQDKYVVAEGKYFEVYPSQ